VGDVRAALARVPPSAPVTRATPRINDAIQSVDVSEVRHSSLLLESNIVTPLDNLVGPCHNCSDPTARPQSEWDRFTAHSGARSPCGALT
jgi:hypothetical protein